MLEQHTVQGTDGNSGPESEANKTGPTSLGSLRNGTVNNTRYPAHTCRCGSMEIQARELSTRPKF
jgi:hypothetical protein